MTDYRSIQVTLPGNGNATLWLKGGDEEKRATEYLLSKGALPIAPSPNSYVTRDVTEFMHEKGFTDFVASSPNGTVQYLWVFSASINFNSVPEGAAYSVELYSDARGDITDAAKYLYAKGWRGYLSKVSYERLSPIAEQMEAIGFFDFTP